MPRMPQNPAISRAERNGYEPWLMWGYETESDYLADAEDDSEEEGDDGDVYYGNETSDF